jgi:hypothetical protein
MNVFLVEAPHQLINGIEARQALCLMDNHVVIIVSRTHPAESFRPLVRNGEWDSVRFIDERLRVRFRAQRYLRDHRSARIRNYYATAESRALRKKLDRIAASIGRAENLLVGCYFNERVRHFANVLPHDRLVLLDDGTTTLQIAEARCRHAAGGVAHPYRRWTEPLVNRVLGWNPRQRDRATFFTTYDLEIPPTDRLIRHSYEYLRSCSAAREHRDEVLFLGMSLYWEGVDEDTYLAQLRRVADHYAGADLVYAPHKGETEERIERISQLPGWTVRRHEGPVEYHLAMHGPVPRVLASFFSSALENCRIIFGSDLLVEAIYFDPELLPQQPHFVATVYHYFETLSSDHFRVIRL